MNGQLRGFLVAAVLAAATPGALLPLPATAAAKNYTGPAAPAVAPPPERVPKTAAIAHYTGAPPSGAAMGVDVLLVRPIGLVATVLGTGLFVVSLPFSALGGNTGEAAHELVARPGKYTFVRSLGDFSEGETLR